MSSSTNEEPHKGSNSSRSKASREILISILLSLFAPPLAVYRKEGMSEGFWVCVLLTLMVIIPGQIYALIVTVFFSEESHDSQVIEVEPEVVVAPKPKRVIAVTPDYMDNSSQADLSIILSNNETASVEKSQERRPSYGLDMANTVPPAAIKSAVLTNQIPGRILKCYVTGGPFSADQVGRMRTQIFIAIAILVVLLSYSLYLVFSNGSKDLGIIGKAMHKAGNVGKYFDKKGKAGQEGDDSMNGTKTEPLPEDEDGKSLTDSLHGQMAFDDSNEAEEYDNSAASEP